MARRAQDHRNELIYSTEMPSAFQHLGSWLPPFQKHSPSLFAFLQNLGFLFYQTHMPYSHRKESAFTLMGDTPHWTPVHYRSTMLSSSSERQGFAGEFHSFPQVKLWALRPIICFTTCSHSTAGLSALSSTSAHQE